MHELLDWIAKNQDAATGLGIFIFFTVLVTCITVYNISSDWANRESGCCCECHDREDHDGDES